MCVCLHVCGSRVACLVYRLCQSTSNTSCHASCSIALTSSASRETRTRFVGGRERGWKKGVNVVKSQGGGGLHFFYNSFIGRVLALPFVLRLCLLPRLHIMPILLLSKES